MKFEIGYYTNKATDLSKAKRQIDLEYFQDPKMAMQMRTMVIISFGLFVMFLLGGFS
jgi:hypothetical protein